MDHYSPPTCWETGDHLQVVQRGAAFADRLLHAQNYKLSASKEQKQSVFKLEKDRVSVSRCASGPSHPHERWMIWEQCAMFGLENTESVFFTVYCLLSFYRSLPSHNACTEPKPPTITFSLFTLFYRSECDTCEHLHACKMALSSPLTPPPLSVLFTAKQSVPLCVFIFLNWILYSNTSF